MAYTSTVARTGRPAYEDESGRRTQDLPRIKGTPGEVDAFYEAAELDGQSYADWARDLMRKRAKQLGVKLPMKTSP